MQADVVQPISQVRTCHKMTQKTNSNIARLTRTMVPQPAPNYLKSGTGTVSMGASGAVKSPGASGAVRSPAAGAAAKPGTGPARSSTVAKTK
jgi:hypothetical protein